MPAVGPIDLEERPEEGLAAVKTHFEELAKSAGTLERRIDEKVERAVEREVDAELAQRGR